VLDAVYGGLVGASTKNKKIIKEMLEAQTEGTTKVFKRDKYPYAPDVLFGYQGN